MQKASPKTKWKTNQGDILEIQLLYEWKGWLIGHIARFKELDRATVRYHIRKRNFIRKAPVQRTLPVEIQQAERLRQGIVKADHPLKYQYWIARCSMTGEILASDTRIRIPSFAKDAKRLLKDFE